MDVWTNNSSKGLGVLRKNSALRFKGQNVFGARGMFFCAIERSSHENLDNKILTYHHAPNAENECDRSLKNLSPKARK